MTLSACSTWQGPALYARSESVDPFPHGVYRYVDNGKAHYAQWDGINFVDLDKKGEKTDADRPDLIIVRVNWPDHVLHVIQTTYRPSSKEQKRQDSEFFLVRRDGRRFLFIMPDCATSKAVVRSAGGAVVRLPRKTISNPGGLVCRFTTRVSLEAAARRYAVRTKLPAVPFTYVGD
jgi:hypothetical protein